MPVSGVRGCVKGSSVKISSWRCVLEPCAVVNLLRVMEPCPKADPWLVMVRFLTAKPLAFVFDISREPKVNMGFGRDGFPDRLRSISEHGPRQLPPVQGRGECHFCCEDAGGYPLHGREGRAQRPGPIRPTGNLSGETRAFGELRSVAPLRRRDVRFGLATESADVWCHCGLEFLHAHMARKRVAAAGLFSARRVLAEVFGALPPAKWVMLPWLAMW